MGLTTSPNDLDCKKIEFSSKVEHANKLTPVIIKFLNQKAKNVQLIGSFTNWQDRIEMEKINKRFEASINLPAGEHQYKFIVDDNWEHDESQDTISDSFGGKNNVLRVEKYESNKSEKNELIEKMPVNDKDMMEQSEIANKENIIEQNKVTSDKNTVINQKENIKEAIESQMTEDENIIIQNKELKEPAEKKEIDDQEEANVQIDIKGPDMNDNLQEAQDKSKESKEEIMIEQNNEIIKTVKDITNQEIVSNQREAQLLNEIKESDILTKNDYQKVENEFKEPLKEKIVGQCEEIIKPAEDNITLNEQVGSMATESIESNEIPLCLKILAVFAVLIAILIYFKR